MSTKTNVIPRSHTISVTISERSIVVEPETLSMTSADDVSWKSGNSQRFSIVFDDYFRPELARMDGLVRDGLVEETTSRVIRVTSSGRIFVRIVAKVFDAFQSAAIASKAV